MSVIVTVLDGTDECNIATCFDVAVFGLSVYGSNGVEEESAEEKVCALHTLALFSGMGFKLAEGLISGEPDYSFEG